MTTRLLRDALLEETKALPNGAAATSTDPFDLEHGDRGRPAHNFELVIEAPALNTTQQPDAKTLKYDVEHSDAAGSGYTTLYEDVITQTGAGGAGAAAAEKRVRLPDDCKRYVRVTVTGSAAGNSSTASMTVYLGF